MTLVITQPPIAEPVTLDEVKTHLRIDHDKEDDLLNALISTAREYLESRTQLALITQSWRLCLDAWPKDQCLLLQKSPVQTIDQIEQFDQSGLAQILSANNMILDGNAHPARLYTHDQSNPDRAINGIEITFTAGFGSASDVPDTLKRAILTHIAHMYEFRGVISQSMQPASVPHGYEALICPWLRRSL
ncbi:MAG: phage head-tail connector protein [Rhizobiaceae bacterium]|nr:phage head-tail connector protein [Rhizobiaceae bacterium]